MQRALSSGFHGTVAGYSTLWILALGIADARPAEAAAIGDDRLQLRAGREVVPESFTHGSAEERQRWLRVGLESGDPSSCDSAGS